MEGETRKIYAVVGKGAVDNNAKSLNALAGLGPATELSRLACLIWTDTKTIPADADGLVIVGPHYDFTEPEMALIQAYWDTKRSALLILMDPNSETPRLREFPCGQWSHAAHGPRAQSGEHAHRPHERLRGADHIFG